jgi:hypothetical protein
MELVLLGPTPPGKNEPVLCALLGSITLTWGLSSASFVQQALIIQK